MLEKIVIASFVFSMCSCSKVKNESVRVIQTDSFSNTLVIQVNELGKYYVYIPSDTVRLKFVDLKAANKDSIWEIKLSEISNTIATYKEITKSEDLKIKIEADRNAEYLPIKNLMKCLQDAGYTQYNLTTKPQRNGKSNTPIWLLD